MTDKAIDAQLDLCDDDDVQVMILFKFICGTTEG